MGGDSEQYLTSVENRRRFDAWTVIAAFRHIIVTTGKKQKGRAAAMKGGIRHSILIMKT